MNVTPDPAPALDAAEPVEDTGAAAKPVRRRRAVVKPAEAGSAASEASDGAPVAAGADDNAAAPEIEPVPKPRRRRSAVAADSPAEAAVSAEVPLPAATAQGVPAAIADPAAFPASADTVPTVAASTVGEAPVSMATEAEPSDTGVAPVAGDTGGGSGPIEDDGPRSRRRNRRERLRAEGAAATDGVGGEGAATAPVASVNRPPPAPPVSTEQVFAQVLSGEFDVEPLVAGEAEPVVDEASAPKRVLQAEVDAPKLHKLLAQSGIGSRRDMEALIEEGQVTVNGETAHVGQRVSFGDQVKVKGKPVRLRIVPPTPRIIAYHKPVGEIVTHDDPQSRPTVFRRLPRLQQGKWQSVGRLDINTEGLLLFTNSGELANQLMHPRFGVEREYAVRVLGICTPEHKARLLEGVDIDGQTASFRSIEDGGGDGANHWYRVVITEGRNREVRRLFDTVGLTVSRLIRIRYGTVVLPFGLKRGVWVDLESGDVAAIRRLASPDGGVRADRGDRPLRGPQAAPGGPRGERQPDRPSDRPGGRGNDRPRNPNGNNHNGHPNGPRPRHGEGAPRAAAAAPTAAFDPGRDGADRDPDGDIDFDPMSIPNPLEQTFDKRFVQNPRSPAGGRGFRNGGGGFGAGGSAPDPVNKKGQVGPKQPDPLQTSLGFIGADAFHRKNRGGGGQGGAGGQGGGGQRGGNRGGNRGGGFGGSGSGAGGGGFNGPGGGRRGR